MKVSPSDENGFYVMPLSDSTVFFIGTLTPGSNQPMGYKTLEADYPQGLGNILNIIFIPYAYHYQVSNDFNYIARLAFCSNNNNIRKLQVKYYVADSDGTTSNSVSYQGVKVIGLGTKQ